MVVAAAGTCASGAPVAPDAPTGLMCELLARPELTVITDATPEFGWIVNDARRGAVQSAYRIVVASTAEGARALRGDVWDSGTVRSSKSVDVEYAGEPLAPGRSYYWRVRTWDAKGAASPWSDTQEFRTGDLGGARAAPAGDPMKGCVWVWYPERPVGGTRYFRRRFDLPAGARVESAEFTLTVDDNFDLHVNDSRVASTGREHNAWKALRRVNVARHLRAGANVIAVAARNSGDAAGFTGKLVVRLAGRAPVTVLVDGEWRTSSSEEPGWERPGFDDGKWPRAKVLGPYGMDPWKRTARLPAAGGGGGGRDAFANRYPLVKTEVQPARVARVGDGHWFVDFGRAAFGTVCLDADSPADGREVEVHLGEVATADGGRINRKPGGTRRYRMMKVRLQQGSHSYEVKVTPDRRNTGGAAIRMPGDVGEVIPFRYCELVGHPGRLDASKVTQIAVHYPFDDEAAAFESSSEVLNQVWELCKYSIKATSFVGVYVDGDRERIPYEADAYINQLCHYCVDREYTMARYSHEYLLRHPTWPLEWQHHSVLMAWEDYLYTGNAESLSEHYDVLAAKTLRALARGDGLIVDDKRKQTREFLRSINMGRQIRTIVDWPSAERDRHKITPVDSVANAFHYRTLALMGRIACALGRDADGARWD
ncbi:MAG: glycoside hydrolase family 78 protein, partial [Planctomycetota bacterium]